MSPEAGTATPPPPKGVVRALKGSVKGRFSIVAGAGTVSASNGQWLIQDTCKGTKIKNLKGTVSVKKQGSKKVRVIKPGKSYVIKAKLFQARRKG